MPARPRGTRPRSSARSPKDFYPRRQKEPSGSGERCQPCPGELGTAKDAARPSSCPPPPPPAGKMLLSPFFPTHHPAPLAFSAMTFPFLGRKGKVKKKKKGETTTQRALVRIPPVEEQGLGKSSRCPKTLGEGSWSQGKDH